ncbi:MAG: Rossmann-like and DUF2520 domain-containing protein [Candidatus Korobacteraceae bacterium]
MPKQSRSARPLTVSIVGPGNLGTALALTLPSAGYVVKFIAARAKSLASAETTGLARRVKAQLTTLGKEPLDSDLVWITVPDDAIAATALRLARTQDWQGKIVFHSSGALTSDDLAPLRERGAKVASVHPGMTFVRGPAPQMLGVAFAVEGDAAATRLAKRIVEDLGGTTYAINKRNKVLYHVFGSFASPMVIALMTSLERVAKAAGIKSGDIKTMMVPLLWQTLRNYLQHDAASAFSGPLARGDVATVRRHLEELKLLPEARAVYVALAKSALKNLPVKNRRAMERVLKSGE